MSASDKNKAEKQGGKCNFRKGGQERCHLREVAFEWRRKGGHVSYVDRCILQGSNQGSDVEFCRAHALT